MSCNQQTTDHANQETLPTNPNTEPLNPMLMKFLNDLHNKEIAQDDRLSSTSSKSSSPDSQQEYSRHLLYQEIRTDAMDSGPAYSASTRSNGSAPPNPAFAQPVGHQYVVPQIFLVSTPSTGPYFQQHPAHFSMYQANRQTATSGSGPAYSTSTRFNDLAPPNSELAQLQLACQPNMPQQMSLALMPSTVMYIPRYPANSSMDQASRQHAYMISGSGPHYSVSSRFPGSGSPIPAFAPVRQSCRYAAPQMPLPSTGPRFSQHPVNLSTYQVNRQTAPTTSGYGPNYSASTRFHPPAPPNTAFAPGQQSCRYTAPQIPLASTGPYFAQQPVNMTMYRANPQTVSTTSCCGPDYSASTGFNGSGPPISAFVPFKIAGQNMSPRKPLALPPSMVPYFLQQTVTSSTNQANRETTSTISGYGPVNSSFMSFQASDPSDSAFARFPQAGQNMTPQTPLASTPSTLPYFSQQAVASSTYQANRETTSTTSGSELADATSTRSHGSAT